MTGMTGMTAAPAAADMRKILALKHMVLCN